MSPRTPPPGWVTLKSVREAQRKAPPLAPSSRQPRPDPDKQARRRPSQRTSRRPDPVSDEGEPYRVPLDSDMAQLPLDSFDELPTFPGRYGELDSDEGQLYEGTDSEDFPIFGSDEGTPLPKVNPDKWEQSSEGFIYSGEGIVAESGITGPLPARLADSSDLESFDQGAAPLGGDAFDGVESLDESLDGDDFASFDPDESYDADGFDSLDPDAPRGWGQSDEGQWEIEDSFDGEVGRGPAGRPAPRSGAKDDGAVFSMDQSVEAEGVFSLDQSVEQEGVFSLEDSVERPIRPPQAPLKQIDDSESDLSSSSMLDSEWEAAVGWGGYSSASYKNPLLAEGAKGAPPTGPDEETVQAGGALPDQPKRPLPARDAVPGPAPGPAPVEYRPPGPPEAETFHEPPYAQGARDPFSGPSSTDPKGTVERTLPPGYAGQGRPDKRTVPPHYPTGVETATAGSFTSGGEGAEATLPPNYGAAGRPDKRTVPPHYPIGPGGAEVETLPPGYQAQGRGQRGAPDKRTVPPHYPVTNPAEDTLPPQYGANPPPRFLGPTPKDSRRIASDVAGGSPDQTLALDPDEIPDKPPIGRQGQVHTRPSQGSRRSELEESVETPIVLGGMSPPAGPGRPRSHPTGSSLDALLNDTEDQLIEVPTGPILDSMRAPRVSGRQGSPEETDDVSRWEAFRSEDMVDPHAASLTAPGPPPPGGWDGLGTGRGHLSEGFRGPTIKLDDSEGGSLPLAELGASQGIFSEDDLDSRSSFPSNEDSGPFAKPGAPTSWKQLEESFEGTFPSGESSWEGLALPEEEPQSVAERMSGLWSGDALWLILTIGGLALGPLLIWAGWGYYSLPESERRLSTLHESLNANRPIGLWAGIAGTILFLLNLTYIARRRFGFLRKQISMRLWLNLHMLCGVTGGSLILVHSGLVRGNLVATVSALAIAFAVASGLFGRYVLAHVPRRQEGDAANRAELSALMAELRGDLRRRLAPYPKLRQVTLQALTQVDEEEEPEGFFAVVWSLFAGGFRNRARDKRLATKFRSLLDLEVSFDPELEGLLEDTLDLLNLHGRLHRRLSQFEGVQDLMDTWRGLHMILALIMVASMIVHVAIAISYGNLKFF